MKNEPVSDSTLIMPLISPMPANAPRQAFSTAESSARPAGTRPEGPLMQALPPHYLQYARPTDRRDRCVPALRIGGKTRMAGFCRDPTAESIYRTVYASLTATSLRP